jgi:hypothetical protein
MSADDNQTKSPSPEFDFSGYPRNTLFHDRRTGGDRRHRGDAGQPGPAGPRLTDVPADRRQKKERRRRIDPTTFEKEYPMRTTAHPEVVNRRTPGIEIIRTRIVV